MTFEGLQIFTYTRHLWPLGSAGSLACHIYCDTGHPLKWSSPRTPIAERLAVELSFPVLRLRFAAGIRKPNLPLAGRTL